MITITGATGQLGRLVVDDLLGRDVPAGQIIAAVRAPAKADDLAARGVQVRLADYTKPDTLRSALAGSERLLLISSSEVGQRVEQHRNVIDAAVAAGVSSIAYTSVLRADTAQIVLAQEHRATEELLGRSGLAFTLLRNGWYQENYTGTLAQTLEHGVLLGSAGDGRVAAANRADYAAAAAAVLTGGGHDGAVYELGGDEPFTMAELAETISEVSGTTVRYQDLPADEYEKALADAGVPAPMAAILADSDRGVARGELTTSNDDLRRLISGPTTPLSDAIRTALDAHTVGGAAG